MYRQGDVLLIPAIRPVDLKPDKPEEIVLALGEATGHRHRFAGGRRSGVRSYRAGAGDGRWIEVVGRARRLVHEEHGTIDVEPGCYEVVIQSQYTDVGVQRVED